MRNRHLTRVRFLFFVFLLTSFSPLFSQTGDQKVLKNILPLLEVKFEVRFSFIEKDLKGITVEMPADDLDLQETLSFLEQRTGLSFELLSTRYIAISTPSEEFKFFGIVKDAATGEPLPGATIVASNRSATAITNKEGEFYFEAVKRGVKFEVRFLGYKDKIITVDPLLLKGSALEISLQPEIYALQETVVTNYLTAGINKSKDGSINIDMDRFGTLPGQVEPDVLQTVESLPGIESVDETISNINIRGGTSDQNLVLLDGMKIYLTGHFFGLISAFNPDLIKDVKVVKNGSSAKLSDGVSGSILINSEDELQKRLAGGAGANFINTEAFLQIPVTKKFELHISGRRSLNDFFDTPTFSSYFSRTFQDTEVNVSSEEDFDSDFSYYDVSLKALYDLNEKQKLRFSLLQINNQLDHSEFEESRELRTSSLYQNNLAFGGNWKAFWSENISTELTSYLTRYNLEASNFTAESEQLLHQENEVLESGLKLNMTAQVNPWLNILTGYDFFETGVSNIEKLNRPFFSSTIKNVIRSHAVFGELKLNTKSTFLRAGLRVNYLQKFEEFRFEPRVSFNQNLGKYFSIKAMGERKSQNISQVIDLQEDFLGVENRRWILANGDSFPVLESEQVSGGLSFKADGWFLDLEIFNKTVDGISTSNQGFQDQNEFIRTSGSYTVRGFEVLINKKAGPLTTYLNYTFGENDYNFDELNPSSFPNNFDIRHSASLAANYTYRNFKFALGAHGRSGKAYTAPVEGSETRQDGNNRVVNFASPNSENLPIFFRVDLSSSYHLDFTSKRSLRIGVGIINLLDRENIINRYYRVDSGDSSRVIEINNTSLGFTPNASLKFTF